MLSSQTIKLTLGGFLMDNYSTAIFAENGNLSNTIANMLHPILDSVFAAEKESKEKYTVKAKLIEEATDMSTPEKLDAQDENYKHRNQERWQNIAIAVISFCVLNHIIGGSISTKKYL